jgi:uncharacterized protein (TIGR02246 family)
MQPHGQGNKVLFVAAVLLAAAAGGYVAVRTTGTAAGDERIGPAPRASDPANEAEEQVIEKNRAAYVKAFNAGDAKALAAFWAPDGEFVDADGKSFKGRDAIAKEFAAFFAQAKGVTLEIHSDSLRFVSPGVAVETGTAHVTRPADDATTATAYSIVHAKRDGRWELASVRETPHTPSSNYEKLRPLEWLVGSWTATADGRTLELSCEWTANRNFLTRKYSLKDAEGATRTGLQVIGWDPAAGGVRSWEFDSEGGFGSEKWTKDGPRWVLEATGVTREGVPTAAVNVVTRLDYDSFTWQSLRRRLNQTELPDTTPLKVTRVKGKK